LALFFQLHSRSPQYAELNSNKLGLFFQIGFRSPAQVWGLTEIGFVFRRPKLLEFA